MTVFNFPDTSGKPTDGTFTWTAPNGLLYSWDGDAWRTVGGSGDGNASITITDDLSTIPAPDAGDLAWHTIEARMYIYYQDNDSQQWVDASPAGDGGGDSLWTSGSNVVGALTPTTDDDVWVNGYVFSGEAVYARNGNSSGKVFVGQGNDSNNTEVFSVSNTGDLSAANAYLNTNVDVGGQFSHADTDASRVGEGYAVLRRNSTASANSYLIRGFRGLSASGDGGNNRVFNVDATGSTQIGGTPASPNIRLDATGFGKFYTPGKTTGNESIANFNSDGNGTDSVAVSIRANGDILQKGSTKPMSVVFELERDNPANFNAEGEYIGPTLDVKDRILNLISRLDALEANEVIDDATDTSLLTLLANASSRLDSIEARLTALEGGN